MTKRRRWARAKWEQSTPETVELVLRYYGCELIHWSIPYPAALYGENQGDIVRAANVWAMGHGFAGLKWTRPKLKW